VNLFQALRAQPFKAWPAALTEPIAAALACHGLLCAKVLGPETVLEAWTQESFGWPKSDFFWWTVSQVKRDEAFLRNVKGDTGQLLRIRPV
jgi:hypothetical protein